MEKVAYISKWFKTYILPSRVVASVLKKAPKGIFMWMVTGLWHGVAGDFVVWGLYFGLIIYLEKTKLRQEY